MRDLAENYRKSGAWQAYQYRQSYEQQQFIALVGIVLCSVISSALCSPELTYVMVIGTYLLVGFGESLTEKLEMTRRRGEDYEAVSDEAFTQIAYNDMMTTEEPGAVAVEEVKLSDGMGYLREAAANWRSHLGLLAPTDTGKSSTLALLLALMSRKQRIMVIAVESKGAEYPGVPESNILRIGFRPSRAEVQQLIDLMKAICDLAQRRANKEVANDFQLVLILEEWLSIYNTVKKMPSLSKLAPVIESYVYTLVGVGRGCGVQAILTAQSNVADDLGVSGSVRSNLRYMALGSNYGGFEGIENAFANYRIVSPSRRESCQLQFEAAIKQLRTNRHPLVLTNLVGRLEIFPAPYLKDSEMSQLQINSLPITDGFLSLDALADLDALTEGRPIDSEPGQDNLLDDLGIKPDTATETPQPISDRPIALDEVEELIIGFLESKPDKNYRASQIKQNVSRLKNSVPLETIEKICEGLAKTARIIPVVDGGDKPRYMAR
jgi:hypothetical protein